MVGRQRVRGGPDNRALSRRSGCQAGRLIRPSWAAQERFICVPSRALDAFLGATEDASASVGVPAGEVFTCRRVRRQTAALVRIPVRAVSHAHDDPAASRRSRPSQSASALISW
jgi:hypothetical protein